MCRTNWFDISDFESDDDQLISFPATTLPPTTTTFDPLTSLKTIATYHISPQTARLIRTVKVLRLSPLKAEAERIALRSTWGKFGDEATNKVPEKGWGIAKTAVAGSEEISFYLGLDWREKERKSIEEKKKLLVVTRNCGHCSRSHLTAQCPFCSQHYEERTFKTTAITTMGKYIPPGARRSGVSCLGEGGGSETTSLRVSNISIALGENALRDRFARYGHIVRTFCARDYRTGEYRGFGYVTFARKEDAEMAMAGMNKRGFDNLIMIVEWDSKDRSHGRM